MSERYEIVIPSIFDQSEMIVGSIREIPTGYKKGWILSSPYGGRSRKGHKTPKLAAANFLRRFKYRGAFMRVKVPKS